ncbi:hypothetical protein GQR58_020049 [Nymphon striatum]|nr:hypothetical protein GQR58_020049 [Nymphon striatum]
MYQAFQPNASSKIWEPGAHKKEPRDAQKGTEIPVGFQENLAHNTHFLVDLNNFCRQQRRMYPSTKCIKFSHLTRPQEIWEPLALCVDYTYHHYYQKNYSNRLRNVCCVQDFLGIKREFQFLFVCPGAFKFFEDALG